MADVIIWFNNHPWLTALLMVLFIAISTIMVLTILIQRPQGGGLSGAFGGAGAGSGQTAFGAKTGDALTWFTIIVFLVFLVFGVVLNYATTPPPVTRETSAAEPGLAPAPTTEAPAAPTPAATEPAPAAPTTTEPASQPASPPPSQPAPPPAAQPEPASAPQPTAPPAQDPGTPR